MLCINAFVGVDGVLMRRVSDGDASVPNLIEAIGNLGVSVGALGCGLAVAIGAAEAYRSRVIVNALTLVGAWAVLFRLPHYDPLLTPELQRQRWIALMDKPLV